MFLNTSCRTEKGRSSRSSVRNTYDSGLREHSQLKWIEDASDNFEFELCRKFQDFLYGKKKKKEVIKWLEAIPREYWEKTNNTVLHFVVSQEKYEILKHCIADGYTSVNCKNNEGKTPLTIAIEKRDTKMAKLLIKTGASLDNGFYNGRFGPLHLATCDGNFEMVKLLIEAGTDVNALDDNGTSPLQVLLMNVREGESLPLRSAAAMLIKARADVNQLNHQDESPLHLAIGNFCFHTALNLLNSGADVAVRDKMNQTPLHLALRKKKFDIARRILASGEVDVNVVDATGMSALLYAMKAGDNEMIRTLISKGADVNLISPDGMSPLCYAVKSHDYALTKLLIDSGARTSVLLASKIDPLREAVRSRNRELIDLLLRVEPDLNAMDRPPFQKN